MTIFSHPISREDAPWRDLPEHFPNWKSVHTRFLRWSKAGAWNLAEVHGIEAARVLLKRVVEMLTRLVLSTARRQIPDRDRERDRDRDRVGAEDSP